jgi:hypothetical protein
VIIKNKGVKEHLFVGKAELNSDKGHLLSKSYKGKNTKAKKKKQAWFKIERDSDSGHCLIKSKKHGRYLYCGEPNLDSDRRHILCWKPDNDTSGDHFHFKIINHGEFYSI